MADGKTIGPPDSVELDKTGLGGEEPTSGENDG
jgi:hypothetical protein